MKVLEWLEVLRARWAPENDSDKIHHRVHALDKAIEILDKNGSMTCAQPMLGTVYYVKGVPKHGWIWQQIVEGAPFELEDAGEYLTPQDLKIHKELCQVRIQRKRVGKE